MRSSSQDDEALRLMRHAPMLRLPCCMGFGEPLVVLVVFGPGRLAEMMGHLGKGLQAFRKGLHEPPEIDPRPEKPTAPVEAKRDT